MLEKNSYTTRRSRHCTLTTRRADEPDVAASDSCVGETKSPDSVARRIFGMNQTTGHRGNECEAQNVLYKSALGGLTFGDINSGRTEVRFFLRIVAFTELQVCFNKNQAVSRHTYHAFWGPLTCCALIHSSIIKQASDKGLVSAITDDLKILNVQFFVRPCLLQVLYLQRSRVHRFIHH